MPKLMIEQVADKIIVWFPEIMGRAVAVMDAEITKQNVPTLPICMVAPIKETPVTNQQGLTAQIIEEILIEFWFSPQKLKRDDNTESVFWACYDYADIRNRLVYHLNRWSPDGVMSKYLGLTFETTPLAQVLAFRFSFEQGFCYQEPIFENCEPNLFSDGKPALIRFSTCPKAFYCEE